jgi:type IX secretion system PorP/SprF family membrane protein
MKKAKIFTLGLLASCLLPNFSNAQDVHFSQFNEVPQLVNPALTASTHDMRGALNYRTQWSSITVPYRTFGGYYEMKLHLFGWKKVKNRSGFFQRSTQNTGAGIYCYRDVAGDGNMGVIKAGLSLSTTIPLNEKNTLSAGLTGAFGQYSINFQELKWASQYNGVKHDPNLSPGEDFSNNSFLNFGVGGGMHWQFGKGEMYMRSNDEIKANLGIAGFHLNRPRYSFLGNSGERMYRKYIVSGGVLIGVKGTNLDIAPSFMFVTQGPSRELLVGSLFKYNLKENSRYTGFIDASAFSLGAFYRNRDALIVTTLYEFGKYAIGISYDINTSRLYNASSHRGGMEITLRMASPNPFLYQAKSKI